MTAKNKWPKVWEEKIKEINTITKWLYIKENRWLPILYTPLQKINAFCNVYCKWKDWIPYIQDVMMEELEKRELSKYPDNWEWLSKRELVEIKVAAWRETQRIWNFFWDCVKIVNKRWRSPFSVRLRHFNSDKIPTEENDFIN